MNCANHADQSAVAYCRTCGKALCANCTRPVKGVIYCEECLGARMASAVPAPPPAPSASAGWAPVPPVPVAPPPPMAASGGPNPALAGILGAIPFGVGAVYNGQYAKGLAHLVIFSLLVAGANAGGRGSETINTLAGIGIFAFIIYQIVDAVRSAQAIRAGLPAPDPFGLAQTFSPAGQKIDAKAIPTGALVLIVLGVIFLLNTAGLFELHFHRVWPVVLILLGGWMLASRWGLLGSYSGCNCERCRAQCMTWPAVLMTLGVVGLIDSFHDVGVLGYVGAIFLVIGAVRLFQSSASTEGHRDLLAPAVPVEAKTDAAPSEVNHV